MTPSREAKLWDQTDHRDGHSCRQLMGQGWGQLLPPKAASAKRPDLPVSALCQRAPRQGPEPLKAALYLLLSLKHLEILPLSI